MSLRIGLIGVISAVALLVSGCLGGSRATATPAGDVPVGQSTHSLTIGDTTRTFRIYRPDGISAPAPLVVMLHGGYGDGAQAERAYHWDAQAEAGHFVVAYPDGLNRAWNAGSCCGQPARAGVDDVAFISAMVGTIEQQIPVDSTRVFVTGMSNGAMMALRLACQSTLFAAVAPVAGTQLTDCSDAVPTSILQIHGTADDRVPYGGGPGKMLTASGAPRVDGPSVESVNTTWRAKDGCAPPVSLNSGDVATQRADCPDGRTVELITIVGAGHQWPGGIANPIVEKVAGLPPPSTALDATATIWQFFAQHHL